jgi:hypothetical protein
MCRNIYRAGADDGLCIIAGPEGVLLESHKSGVHTAILDMDRLHWLRNQEDILKPPSPWKVKPGLLTQWRRPELYKELVK